MVIANMVESLLRAGGGDGDERRSEDHRVAPVEDRGDLCPAVVDGAGPRAHRVDRPAVRPGRGRRSRLGWAAADVEVIDADLGVSGRSARAGTGSGSWSSRVCLGEVGAVFGLEVSRLARSSADFARLLELARLTDTLVIDGDGVYDLSDFNDRLLLGLKGTHVGGRAAPAGRPVAGRETRRGGPR